MAGFGSWHGKHPAIASRCWSGSPQPSTTFVNVLRPSVGALAKAPTAGEGAVTELTWASGSMRTCPCHPRRWQMKLCRIGWSTESLWEIPLATLKEQVLGLPQRMPGLTDCGITDQSRGRAEAQQPVNTLVGLSLLGRSSSAAALQRMNDPMLPTRSRFPTWRNFVGCGRGYRLWRSARRHQRAARQCRGRHDHEQ